MKRSSNVKVGYGIVGKITRKIAEHEGNAEILRKALELLTGSNGHNGKAHTPSVMADALALDQQRRTRVKRHTPVKPSRKHAKSMQKEQLAVRAKTARLLKRLEQSDAPYQPEGKDIGKIRMLSRFGYIARKGDGWMRTDKPFSPTRD